MKTYQDLTFVDDFMFCKIMTAYPSLCRRILSLILKKKIKKVNIRSDQKAVSITAESKGIRMDVYLDDGEGTIYDLEMQAASKPYIPKRLRYYQGILDLNHLQSGRDYGELPHTVIIFVCTFDYFSKRLPKYTFENRCVELPSLQMGDASEKIFINPDSSRNGLDDDFNAFLDYLQGRQSGNALIEEIETAVKKARTHKEWEVEYMTWQAFEMDAKREGRAEGRAEDIERMLKNGKTIEQIADFCGYKLAEVKAVSDRLMQPQSAEA